MIEPPKTLCRPRRIGSHEPRQAERSARDRRVRVRHQQLLGLLAVTLQPTPSAPHPLPDNSAPSPRSTYLRRHRIRNLLPQHRAEDRQELLRRRDALQGRERGVVQRREDGAHFLRRDDSQRGQGAQNLPDMLLHCRSLRWQGPSPTATEEYGHPGGTCSAMGTAKRRAQRRRSRLIHGDLSKGFCQLRWLRRGCTRREGGEGGRGGRDTTGADRLFTVIGAVLPQCVKIPRRSAGTNVTSQAAKTGEF